MRRWIVFAGFALHAGALFATRARAQAAPTPAAAANCGYSECAVRFEGHRLVRGVSGRPAGSIGLFHSSAIDTLLAGPDSAAVNARTYVSENRKSAVYALIGLAAFVATKVHVDAEDDVAAIDFVGFGAAIVSAMLSGHHAQGAAKGLSRSVWWYNSAYGR